MGAGRLAGRGPLEDESPLNQITRAREHARRRKQTRLRESLADAQERIAEWNVALNQPGINHALVRSRLEVLNGHRTQLSEQLSEVEACDVRSHEDQRDPKDVAELWRSLITGEPRVGRIHASHLITRVEIFGERVVLAGRA